MQKCFCVLIFSHDHQRYTNSDLKIYLYVCVHIKTIPWKFRFLNPENPKLFACEVCKFLKKQANFYLILLLLKVCKKTFQISHVRISQNLKGILMWNLRHIIYWHIFMWNKDSGRFLNLHSCTFKAAQVICFFY